MLCPKCGGYMILKTKLSFPPTGLLERFCIDCGHIIKKRERIDRRRH